MGDWKRDPLTAGPAVPVDDPPVCAVGVEVLRLYYLGIEVRAVVGFDGQELAGQPRQLERRTGALPQDLHLASIRLQNGGDRRAMDVGELVYHILSISGEGRGVKPGSLGDLVHEPAFDIQ